MPVAKSSKKSGGRFKKFLGKFATSSLILISTITILLALFESAFADKYFPQTFIGDTNVSLLTRAQATRAVSAKFSQRKQAKLQIEGRNFTIDLSSTPAKIDYSVIDLAFLNGHSGFLPQKLFAQMKTLILKSVFIPTVSVNADSQLEHIARAVYKEPVDAQIIFNDTVTQEGTPSADIQIKEGKDGTQLDKDTLEKNISDFLTRGIFNGRLPLTALPPKISTGRARKAKLVLETSITKPLILKFESSSWTIDAKQLLTLLDLASGQDRLLDKDKAFDFLNQVASQIDRPVQEGQFEFNQQTQRATAFNPSQEGRKLDVDKTYLLLTQAYAEETSGDIALPVDIVKPKIATADVNNLGIKQLLGQGISYFAGSIPNRIYNIGLTASKINGVLVAPGDIFSFNQTVGDISAATGFKPAYVIKEGRTVLDDGGGVCQDSTTLFRAVLNAGLPIAKRTAHAYRVGYYEQGFPPGLDATVYYPSVDFQFKNDTAHYILIQAYVKGNALFVNLYGTSDGRISTISTPIVKNQTPPPPDLRQDDPTLPKGTVKQVDWAAWGANVTFTRTVTRGNDTLVNETWYSNYKPWQAVYLVGTQ